MYTTGIMKYSDLSEQEKIPLRIQAAEEEALKDLRSGICLSKSLKSLVEQEQYSGAEGIKRAYEKLNMVPCDEPDCKKCLVENYWIVEPHNWNGSDKDGVKTR